jgi:hypothetical protein
MNMGISCQPSAIGHQLSGKSSLVVRRWSFALSSAFDRQQKHQTSFACNLFKHKNAPAMLPEHWLYLMAES